jgi:hypothetical protein
MKNALRVMASVALLVAFPSLASRPDRRQTRQQARIADGVRSGELTARETARLERREANIRRDIRKSRAKNGGTLNAQDRARIEAKQDSVSRQIYRQKHDGQSR